MLKNFDDYVGQDKIKSNLLTFINSANIQKKCLDHIFIYGQSGMGKSTLAKLIAKNLQQKIHIYYANNFRKPTDLFSCLTKMKTNEILFIDEIHRLNKELEEFIYPVLESYSLSIMMGKEYNAKIVNVKLSNFTIIVATTELHKVSEQLLNRFPIFLQLTIYNELHLSKIIINLLNNKNIKIEKKALTLIVNCTKLNPRIANNLIKRIYDFCLVDNISNITFEYLNLIFQKLNIFENGITEIDKIYLEMLQNGPYSLKTMQQLTNYPLNMIINKIEPNLLKNDYIKKTNKGRILTNKGLFFIKNLLKNVKYK